VFLFSSRLYFLPKVGPNSSWFLCNLYCWATSHHGNEQKTAKRLHRLNKILTYFWKYSTAPFIGTLVVWIANYLNRLGTAGKFVDSSTKLTCLDFIGYRIKYSRELWLLELQIRCGRRVQTQVHTVYSNSRTSNCQCSLLSKKNPIIWIFCISGSGWPSQFIRISGVLL
jgi:hypothetical protein